METAVRVIQYSPRALAVRGNTKPIKDRLSAMGARFNARLKEEGSDNRFAGWIFSKHRLNKILQILTDAERDGLIGGVEIDMPENINDTNAGDYMPDYETTTR